MNPFHINTPDFVSSVYKDQGFSLIELMITVAIIGILAAIVLPSYSSYVQKSNRTEATRNLTVLAGRQEDYYMDYRRYAADTDELGIGATYVTESGYYQITTASIDTNADFTLTATAVGRQAGDTRCATFTLSSEGEKGATSSECW